MSEHHYATRVTWTGNLGAGTQHYAGYRREHDLDASGKPTIAGSSDPAFRGDPSRWNPEELLVASLSQCHMLWYLHLCALAKVVVTAYVDDAVGTMVEHADGSGEFTSVTLRPTVTVAAETMVEQARQIHGDVHRYCFIARSVKFPVGHEPTILVADPPFDPSADPSPTG